MNGMTPTLLPKKQRRITVETRPDGQLVLVAGFHFTQEGKDRYLYHTAIPFSEFSQTLTCLDDLECFAVDAVKRKTG